MRRVRDVMSPRIAYVTRDATVRAAVELLRSHHLHVLPVLQDGRIIGLADGLTLTLYDPDCLVEEAGLDAPFFVEAAAPLAHAARRMRLRGVTQVPVLERGRFVGTLSVHDLLRVKGEVDDSLTGLPVQHQVRARIASWLASGVEVVVLFLDLDDFRRFNKEHTHIVGDRVLRGVAEVLRQETDPARDFAGRWGGDEFAVATIREREEARALADRLRERIGALKVEGAGEQVRVSVGLAGGRRQAPRPQAHPEATVDGLVGAASRASSEAKGDPAGVREYGAPGREVPGGAPSPAQEGTPPVGAPAADDAE
jgi:diguanylate cyclase (GGDEF)-like protein